jgi:hypothetical protein
VAAALNRCDGRPVLLGWSTQRSRGARCRSAETLRTVRPGMARPLVRGGGRYAEVGFSGRKTTCVKINNPGRAVPRVGLYFAAEPRPSAFGHGPMRRPSYVCGLYHDRLPEFRASSSLAHGAPSGLHFCASLVCDVCWWTIVGVPRDLSG